MASSAPADRCELCVQLADALAKAVERVNASTVARELAAKEKRYTGPELDNLAAARKDAREARAALDRHRKEHG
jgi:hypothetical protein